LIFSKLQENLLIKQQAFETSTFKQMLTLINILLSRQQKAPAVRRGLCDSVDLNRY
jgi:hypothetical protein